MKHFTDLPSFYWNSYYFLKETHLLIDIPCSYAHTFIFSNAALISAPTFNSSDRLSKIWKPAERSSQNLAAIYCLSIGSFLGILIYHMTSVTGIHLRAFVHLTRGRPVGASCNLDIVRKSARRLESVKGSLNIIWRGWEISSKRGASGWYMGLSPSAGDKTSRQGLWDFLFWWAYKSWRGKHIGFKS